MSRHPNFSRQENCVDARDSRQALTWKQVMRTPYRDPPIDDVPRNPIGVASVRRSHTCIVTGTWTHACVAVCPRVQSTEPKRPRSPRTQTSPGPPSCACQIDLASARATAPTCPPRVRAPADRQSPVDARQDSASRRRHAGGPRTTTRLCARAGFWQLLVHGEVGRAGNREQAAAER